MQLTFFRATFPVVEIPGVNGRASFVVDHDGCTGIEAKDGIVIVKMEGNQNLIFTPFGYGTAEPVKLGRPANVQGPARPPKR